MKNWLIRVEYYGKLGPLVPVGNSGAMPCHYSRRSYILKAAENFRRSTGGGSPEIYLFPDSLWTQKVCELGPSAFAEYVIRHGQRLI